MFTARVGPLRVSSCQCRWRRSRPLPRPAAVASLAVFRLLGRRCMARSTVAPGSLDSFPCRWSSVRFETPCRSSSPPDSAASVFDLGGRCCSWLSTSSAAGPSLVSSCRRGAAVPLVSRRPGALFRCVLLRVPARSTVCSLSGLNGRLVFLQPGTSGASCLRSSRCRRRRHFRLPACAPSPGRSVCGSLPRGCRAPSFLELALFSALWSSRAGVAPGPPRLRLPARPTLIPHPVAAGVPSWSSRTFRSLRSSSIRLDGSPSAMLLSCLSHLDVALGDSRVLTVVLLLPVARILAAGLGDWVPMGVNLGVDPDVCTCTTCTSFTGTRFACQFRQLLRLLHYVHVHALERARLLAFPQGKMLGERAPTGGRSPF